MKKLKNNWITKDKGNRLYEIPVPILGLTGGIATGKTTVAQMFRDAGVPVIDADKLVKSIYQKRSSYEFVLMNFPEAITENDIHFKKLREVAFTTAENQLMIETFIYSQMPEAFKEAYLSHPQHDYIVYDVPLLFEKNLNVKIDTSICTYAPRSTQLERLVKRDQITVDLAEKILSRQMDIEEKKKKSDLFIENLSDLASLKNNFDQLLTTLTE
ncbi:MAG: dephospho-CoA kinase [Bacteriovorax sp.]|nr:dephospho-CoA kinase [Bacteriovorax sp.]